MKGWRVTDLGNGRAEVAISWDGMREATLAAEADELQAMIVDLAGAYYRITGALPPAVRRADVGAASRTAPPRAQILKAAEASRTKNRARARR